MQGWHDEKRSGWSLSLVIPACNEAEGIRQAIAEADDALAALVSRYEILVVDDGSSDGTAAAVRTAARGRSRIRLLRHTENRGYGAALRTGFVSARFDRVAFTDADCQFDLADLASLLPLTCHYPLVVGYRIGRQDPWLRRFFSWGYNTLVRALLGTGVRDCDCALKVFRAEALASLLPETPGFFVNTEMLARARQLGYEIVEVGVRHRPRLRGASKVSLRDIPRTLATLLPFWWSQVCGRSERHPGAECVGILPGVNRMLRLKTGIRRLEGMKNRELRTENDKREIGRGKARTPIRHSRFSVLGSSFFAGTREA